MMMTNEETFGALAPIYRFRMGEGVINLAQGAVKDGTGTPISHISTGLGARAWCVFRSLGTVK